MGLDVTGPRLYAALGAVAPVVGVSVPRIGVSAGVRIDFAPNATAQQQAAAQAVLQAFDWGAQADAIFTAQQVAVQATIGIDNGQTSAADYPDMLSTAVMAATLDQINTVRALVQPPLPPVQLSDFVAGIKGKIQVAAQTPPPKGATGVAGSTGAALGALAQVTMPITGAS